ncbi:hypothetical protein F3157_16915 [Virgibacillus dakarensis]|uniref:Uncharacterized protein n=1 Tax=Lentibacillus populi TaxID=1827502 RepID=A0A9W5TXD8_9BACI|nr:MULTISPECIES: hypothetical protein [Bacillaceae]MBT2214596.1 hypothetical protein [Virgibacillus dakarensis]MTW87322.1 hypothetical protein [Virgibacillus dakarensis]GGB40542.1 hypothetical protein GCM10011409_17570 [Lentibacillus populi]
MKRYRELAFELDSQLIKIKSETEIAYGALEFLKELVDKMQVHSDAASFMLKEGIMQRKLKSLITLLDYSIVNIGSIEEEAVSNLQPIFEYFREEDEVNQ